MQPKVNVPDEVREAFREWREAQGQITAIEAFYAGWQAGLASIPEPPKYMTVAEVVKALRSSNTTVHRLLHEGKIPYIRVGTNYRIERSIIEEFQRNGGENDVRYQPRKYVCPGCGNPASSSTAMIPACSSGHLRTLMVPA